MKLMVFLLLLISLCNESENNKMAEAAETDGLSIVYTGNMGVLIRNNESSVLIDGLHEYYGRDYLNPPDSVIEKMMHNEHPFEKLDLVLFTHYHRDHFSRKLAAEFLSFSANRRIAGSEQVRDSLRNDRVLNVSGINKRFIYDSTLKLSVSAYDIPHTWPQRHSAVQNIGYLVQFNGFRIFHIGDADIRELSFKNQDFIKPDVLIVPVWFLMEAAGKRIIEDVLQPGKVIVTHIAPLAELNRSRLSLIKIPTYFFEQIGEVVSVF